MCDEVNNIENKIVLYTDKNGKVELKADVEKDTLWATQEQIAQVFDTSKQLISWHLTNIFKEKELTEKSVVKDSLTTAKDGKKYKVKFYNLDAIIAVGYRVNSKEATKFRIWATTILREYLLKGYSLNKRTLTNSKEQFDDLRKAITFIESKTGDGKVKGKIIVKLTKDVVNQ